MNANRTKELDSVKIAGPTPGPSAGVANQNSDKKVADMDFRAAVLKTVQTEIRQVSSRSQNIVVTGMPVSNMASDKDQFVELCSSELSFLPDILSASRLGEIKQGRIQPLLIKLSSNSEADHLVSNARQLRKSRHAFVRENIYINRHLTKAEAAHAYEIRAAKP